MDSMDTSLSNEASTVDQSVADNDSQAAQKTRHVLLEEFKSWEKQVKNKDIKDIKLKQTVDSEEGTTTLEFRLDSKQVFTLHCPLHYPAYCSNEENFFVEAKCGLHAW